MTELNDDSKKVCFEFDPDYKRLKIKLTRQIKIICFLLFSFQFHSYKMND